MFFEEKQYFFADLPPNSGFPNLTLDARSSLFIISMAGGVKHVRSRELALAANTASHAENLDISHPNVKKPLKYRETYGKQLPRGRDRV